MNIRQRTGLLVYIMGAVLIILGTGKVECSLMSLVVFLGGMALFLFAKSDEENDDDI